MKKNKRILLIIVLVSFAVIYMSACASEDMQNIVENNKGISKLVDNSYFKYDTRGSMFSYGTTFNRNYLFIDYLKMNLFDGKITYVCDIKGCNHNPNQGCKVYDEYNARLGVDDYCLIARGNKLYKSMDNSEEVIFENTFCSKYDIENFPDNPYDITGLTISEDGLYISLISHYIIFDMATGTYSEPKMLGDGKSTICSLAVNDNIVYYADDKGNIYACGRENEEFDLIASGRGPMVVSDNTFYYIQWENAEPHLYKIGDDKKAIKILDDCNINFYVSHGYVIYQSYKCKNIINIAREDGRILETINFENNDKYISGENYNPMSNKEIIGTDGVDKVFISDRENHMIYMLNHDYKGYLEYEYTDNIFG